MNHQYTLQPYKGMWSRYTCPQCHRHKVFTRYINTTTDEPIAPDVGRCSRELNCGYHYTPAQHFSKHGKPQNAENQYKTLSYKAFEPSYMPVALLSQTVKNYHNNNLVQYLVNRFGHDIAYAQARLYLVGTSNHWPGANIFWQVDTAGRLHTGKIMLYNSQTGKRVKEPFNHIAWAHLLMRKSEFRMRNEKKASATGISHSEFQLKQCLFGEHLLSYETGKAVAMVESEKTAIIGSVYYPDMIWLAAGSLQGLTLTKCQCLVGRRVILVPDVNGYELWQKKAAQLSAAVPALNFILMPLLENHATQQQKAEGWDLADFL